MTAGSASKTVRASGRLVVNPTDLSAAFPHGGTEVGRTQTVVVQTHGEPYFIESEGLGRASDMLQGDNRYTFACILRGHDDDAIELLLSDGESTGAETGHRVYSAHQQTPGTTMLGRGVVLLYVPDDLINVDALIVHNGIPGWVPGSEIPFQRQTETVIPFAAECFPNSSGNVFDIGRFADLTL